MSLGVVGGHAESLFAFSQYAQRFFPCILYLRVGTSGMYREVFHAVGELQDFFPRFLDLRRDSFRAFSTGRGSSPPFLYM
jgi:hypothetical protein